MAEWQVDAVAIGRYVAWVYAAAVVSSESGPTLVRRSGPIRTSQVALSVTAAGLLLMTAPLWRWRRSARY